MPSAPRICLVLAALAGAACGLVVPAMAADRTIEATKSNTWTPSSVTISTGQTVRFSNSNDGVHDLRFDGASQAVTPLSSSWTYERTFSTAGTFRFICTIHAQMKGSVVVQQGTTTSGGGGTTTPGGTTTTPGSTTSTSPPPASGLTASFGSAPKSLRTSRAGRFTYRFAATSLSSGKVSLRSTKRVKVGATSRIMKLAARSFTASSSGKAKATFTLSPANRKALRRVKRLRFAVAVTLGGKTFRTTLTLRAPATT